LYNLEVSGDTIASIKLIKLSLSPRFPVTSRSPSGILEQMAVAVSTSNNYYPLSLLLGFGRLVNADKELHPVTKAN